VIRVAGASNIAATEGLLSRIASHVRDEPLELPNGNGQAQLAAPSAEQIIPLNAKRLCRVQHIRIGINEGL
jgi:hypothetical protein